MNFCCKPNYLCLLEHWTGWWVDAGENTTCNNGLCWGHPAQIQQPVTNTKAIVYTSTNKGTTQTHLATLVDQPKLFDHLQYKGVCVCLVGWGVGGGSICPMYQHPGLPSWWSPLCPQRSLPTDHIDWECSTHMVETREKMTDWKERNSMNPQNMWKLNIILGSKKMLLENMFFASSLVISLKTGNVCPPW